VHWTVGGIGAVLLAPREHPHPVAVLDANLVQISRYDGLELLAHGPLAKCAAPHLPRRRTPPGGLASARGPRGLYRRLRGEASATAARTRSALPGDRGTTGAGAITRTA
jgi:hypothetical protein